MPAALDLARSLQDELVALRRDFHRHPEIAWEEIRTSKIVGDFCEKEGLQVTRGAAKTGVIATLNPEKSGGALALRADMDALPIHEENSVEYRSKTDGKGHLCGHDAHTTMLLGAVKLLARYKEKIPFPVRFVFQPAEEVAPGGAEALLNEGRLDGVTEIFGLHVNPLIPVGVLGMRDGPFMASMDRFDIYIEGVGGHGAMPHLARDPVLAGSEIVMALQSIVARRVDPLDPAVVSVCGFQAGSAFNVIPPRARLFGTARSLTASVRKNLPEWIEQIAQQVAAAHGQTAKLDYVFGTPVLNNHEEPNVKLARAFRALGGSDAEIKATMGGEDFAFYLEKIPGSFAFLGAGDGSPSTSQCFHHPKYNIDERALAWGSALFLQVVCDRAGIQP